MEAAGYRFDELESTKEQLCFVPDGVHQISGVMLAKTWDEVQEWLDQIVIDDPFTAEQIKRILHPEQYEKTFEEYQFWGIKDLKEKGVTVDPIDYKCVYSGLLLQSDDLNTLYRTFDICIRETDGTLDNGDLKSLIFWMTAAVSVFMQQNVQNFRF